MKVQTASGVKFTTSKTIPTTVETSKNHLTMVNNYFGKDTGSSEQESKANALEQSVNDAAVYE